MAIIFEILYHKDRPTLVLLEEKYGLLNFKPPDEQVEYDPIFDDPEFQMYDRLMRQKPRVGGGDY